MTSILGIPRIRTVWVKCLLPRRVDMWVTFPSAGLLCHPPFCRHDHRWGDRTSPVAGPGWSQPRRTCSGGWHAPRGGRGPARRPFRMCRSVMGVHWQRGRSEGERAAPVSIPGTRGVLLPSPEHTTPQLVPRAGVQPISFPCVWPFISDLIHSDKHSAYVSPKTWQLTFDEEQTWWVL